MNIVCVGDCGIDHYLPVGDKLVGGISANFARHARSEFRDTDRVHLISAVGDDSNGRVVRAALAGTGIDCHIAEHRGATPVQYIEIQDDGERRFINYEEGVLRDFRLRAEDRKLIAASDLLVAPVYLQIVGLFDDLMSIATTGLTCIDFADFLEYPDFRRLERYGEQVDVAFFGLAADDREMIGQIRKLAARNNKLYVVTLGAGGSIAFAGATQFECAAIAVDRVLDTTGAGDAYAAGFLSRYCGDGNVAESMSAGARLAAKVIGVRGAGYTAPG